MPDETRISEGLPAAAFAHSFAVLFRMLGHIYATLTGAELADVEGRVNALAESPEKNKILGKLILYKMTRAALIAALKEAQQAHQRQDAALAEAAGAKSIALGELLDKMEKEIMDELKAAEGK